MAPETVLSVLKRKMPDVSDSTLAEIENGCKKAGVMDGVMLKKATRDDIRGQLSKFLLRFVTEKGMFLTEEESGWMQHAKALVENSILKQVDVQFEQIKVFEAVPWPSLNAVPSQIVTTSGQELWLLGRSSFASLVKKFVEADKGCMDFDGTIGSGKTYLQLMLACRCLHDFRGTDKRLVCLFNMPLVPSMLIEPLKKALLVAFWDIPRVQWKVLAAEDVDELTDTVKKLKRSYKLFFIFDEWNALDEPRDPGRQKVWEVMLALEENCRSLHGGSARCARSDAAGSRADRMGVARNGQYDPLSGDELKAFLAKEGVAEHSLLLHYTGLLPLYVRVFVACQKEAKTDTELVEAYVDNHEVRMMLAAFSSIVQKMAESNNRKQLEELYSRLLSGTARLAEFQFVGDQRWIVVTKDRHLRLFSDYARDSFMRLLETERKSPQEIIT